MADFSIATGFGNTKLPRHPARESMKIVFRLNYRTRPGQSLWLKLTTRPARPKHRSGQLLPLRWINENQWQTELELPDGPPVRLEYSYQLRQDSNGLELDEWNGPRTAMAESTVADTLLLRDTWCSAGTPDYAFETAAFRMLLPARGGFTAAAVPADANHTFQLRMAAVPAGRVPCLLGGTAETGGWDWNRAIPLCEVSANHWELHLHLPENQGVAYKYGLYDPASRRAVCLEAGENRVLEPRGPHGRQWTVVRDEGFHRDATQFPRAAGVAIPVFSLRSAESLGTGEFADLMPLADWAAGIGLKMIQILPVNDTTSSGDWTDSYPYSAISAFALHPLYLRIDAIGHAMDAEFRRAHDDARARLNALECLDYVEVMQTKTALTRRIFATHHRKITAGARFRKFLRENREWLVPYAAFCVKRDEHATADFSRWGEWAVFDRAAADAMAAPEHPQWQEFCYHVWLQYELDLQLADAVRHLHRAGVILKGDLPIGVNRHSADTWAAPRAFKMDAQAGAPPDAFSTKGQNWGFPTYDWDAMRADGYAWWRARFSRLARYFDAYRIDHILGFFRIWQIPLDQLDGVMGWFDPAMPVHIDEIRARGIPFDFNRCCRPYIRAHFLADVFGDTADEALRHHLADCGGGFYQLRPHVATQRLIARHFESSAADANTPASRRAARLRDGLMSCAAEVLFHEVPGSHGTLFHPRCAMQLTRSFLELDHDVKCRLDDLHVDYFHRRQEGFWQARGCEKLPAMRRASGMLLCGEDLGMVPDCVPGVMRELGILSLEIQRMPKSATAHSADPAHAPYLSVVSTSTHDMPVLRSWWRHDSRARTGFAWRMFGEAFPPLELPGEAAARIIADHLDSPAMWAVFPLQDLLAIDENLRHPDPDAERINDPSVMPHYWRYRMHLDIAQLAAAEAFNTNLRERIAQSGR